MIRLVRSPSRWVILLIRLVLATGWAVLLSAAVYIAWPQRVGIFLVMVALGSYTLACLWRTLRDREPLLEIDRQALAYGDSAQLHIVEQHPQSVSEMNVKLVGECSVTAALDISHYREKTVSLTRCYEEELLRVAPHGEPLSRTLQLHLPKSAPADDVAWKIVVGSTLKQGGIVEHPFPLRVRGS
jgi:hypothetical protein